MYRHRFKLRSHGRLSLPGRRGRLVITLTMPTFRYHGDDYAAVGSRVVLRR